MITEFKEKNNVRDWNERETGSNSRDVYKRQEIILLPQFTIAVIREITKKKLSLTQSSERNVNTKIPWDATCLLYTSRCV